MLSNFFKKVQATANLGLGFIQLNTNPQTYEQLCTNKQVRYQSIVDAKANLEDMAEKDSRAVKVFWANQTVVLLHFIRQHQSILAAQFNIALSINPTKTELIETIDKLQAILEKGSFQYRTTLIDLIITDTRINNSANDTPPSMTKPGLFVQKKNSIEFLEEQLALGQKVVIMDAANAQRPGAGGYEQGTFQEALTRASDLYWKVLADFRPVLTQTKKYVNVAYNKQDLEVDVLNYQSRYLRLILHFTKQAIINPNYLAVPQFRADFFSYADGIYGDMENTVFELPIDGGFLKNCHFFQMSDIKSTADLFQDDELISFDNRLLGRAFVVEVAAPDKRKLESRYDLSCAIDCRRRQSNYDDALANQMITDALEFTVKCAIEQQADTIILNAFGCGAFQNNPAQVASLFAQALEKYQVQLCSKTIYFMDLNPTSVQTFGQVFSDKLSQYYDINPLSIRGCQINVVLNPYKQTNNSSEFIVMPTNNNLVKLSGIEANLSRDTLLTETNIIRVPNSDFEGEPKNFITLKKSYIKLLEQIAQNKDAKLIRFPLLGTGNLKFHPLDSIQAFIESIEEVSLKYQELQDKKFVLHIPDAPKYKLVHDWLWNKQKVNEELEIKRQYTITLPDTERKKAFIGGVFLTNVRTTLTSTWKPWTRINDQLFLGKIPTVPESVQIINDSNQQLGLVISAVEDFELAGSGVELISAAIQRPVGWKKAGVNHHQVMVRDLVSGDFPTLQVIRSVALCIQTIENGQAVYVHCKAGRSRSATIVFLIEYLLAQRHSPSDQVITKTELADKLKSLRPEISISSNHFELIDRAVKLIQSNPALLEPELAFIKQPVNTLLSEKPLKEQIDTYLASTQAKLHIAQLSEFKELRYQAILTPTLTRQTQTILDSIYAAKNGDWFRDLTQLETLKTEAFQVELCELIAQELEKSPAEIAELTGVFFEEKKPQLQH